MEGIEERTPKRETWTQPPSVTAKALSEAGESVDSVLVAKNGVLVSSPVLSSKNAVSW
jgi:hypothetical protein